jgi:hypothetical protein
MVQLQPDIIIARISDSMDTLSGALNPASVNKSSNSDSVIPMDRFNQAPFQPARNEENTVSSRMIAAQLDYWASSPSRLRFLLGTIEYQKQSSKHKGRQQQEIYAKYQLPSWLSTRVWECKALETLSGWRLNIGTYRTVSPNCTFFTHVRRGNIGGVQEMLSSREAFISDRAMGPRYVPSYGLTALHIAAEYGQFEICELLLAHGADPLALDYMNRTPLHEVIHNARSLFSEQDRGVQGCKPWETCRAILNAGGYEILIENTNILKDYSGPTASEFRVLHLN